MPRVLGVSEGNPLDEREDLSRVDVGEMSTSALVREVARGVVHGRRWLEMPDRYSHSPRFQAALRRTVDNIKNYVKRCEAELDRRVPRPERTSFSLTINGRAVVHTSGVLTGAEIRDLAGAPSDWVINMLVDEGEDPQVLPGDVLDLRYTVSTKFRVRSPHTSSS